MDAGRQHGGCGDARQRLRGGGEECVEAGAVDREHETRIGAELAGAERQGGDEGAADLGPAMGERYR